MISARIETVGVNPASGSIVVLLRTDERVLPISIGVMEAQHIMVALGHEKPSRPLTPDLIVSMLDFLNARLEHIEITELRDGVYYARLIIQHKGIEFDLDARPSDALALALRVDAPILIAPAVLREAGLDDVNLQLEGETVEA
jgi:hypothetical protein